MMNPTKRSEQVRVDQVFPGVIAQDGGQVGHEAVHEVVVIKRRPQRRFLFQILAYAYKQTKTN